MTGKQLQPKPPPAILLASAQKHEVTNASLISVKHKLQEFTARIVRSNRCLHGLSMTKVIEILRFKKTTHTFFASAKSESLILEWQTQLAGDILRNSLVQGN